MIFRTHPCAKLLKNAIQAERKETALMEGQSLEYGWPICQFYGGCVQRSETHHCGFVESHSELRSAARTPLESQTLKLASRGL